MVLRRDEIEYPAFYELNIPYKTLTHTYIKGDKTLHFKFYKFCKENKPDIIHAWGNMPAFISLLAIILLKIPLVNSQITDAPPSIRSFSLQSLINKINFIFSAVILANSFAGLKIYGLDKSKKSAVIYNGVNLNRFGNLFPSYQQKKVYGIKTKFVVIMVASFTNKKNYDIFLDIAKRINLIRKDVSFIAVGDGDNLKKIKQRAEIEAISNLQFLGKIPDVENVVFCSDIGVLFSPFGEGISNAIIEYMALGKPVIANDAGGTREIVNHGVNGFLITTETADEIVSIINSLLDDEEKRLKMGEAGKQTIRESFTVDRMGKEFIKVYTEVLNA